MRILLVEDDPLIGDAVASRFVREQHVVEWVKCGETALNAIRTDEFDLVMLDLGLPEVDGIRVLKTIRKRGVQCPVLILTARDAVEDRILGLDSGADDYLIKPFDLDELLARSRALVRRSAGRSDGLLQAGELTLDPARHVLDINNQTFELSRHEFMVLQCLIERAGRVVSKSQLEDLLYGWEGGAESNTIEVYISQIRRKIGAARIKTLRGVGYIFR